ncbi:hypothetical protein [Rhodococcus sp. IEGM 1408]|uniref:hypothetical protein n=1 Tax=Rhodococcus sp. IEGM 1408 TaxID=3082220 RepID=UPI002955D637|nr:hypothetical protein [Rhodococcus sp. IEGM 1408]MDV8001007.1 hypothetical protein [Rhodococcus sp. IEGM 1408]
MASAAVFAGAGLTLAAPAASAAPEIKSVSTATYVSVSDLGQAEFDAIDALADQINDVIPGDEEIVFVVNQRGPRSAIGLFTPGRSQNALMVECDPEVDTWASYLAGSCQGNEETLPH